jgi:hypothetical protein
LQENSTQSAKKFSVRRRSSVRGLRMPLRVGQLSARRGLPKQIFVLEKQDCMIFTVRSALSVAMSV